MNKRYSTYLKERFGTRVRKISVDAGFSCPNRDGSLSRNGCIYCDNRAFSYHSRNNERLPLKEQISRGRESARVRFKADKFIVYFQAHTNTYADIDELKSKYDVVKRFNDIVGISIATRPDCVNEAVLELIAGYADDYEVWVEYGLQSIHNNTLALINRQHSYEDFLQAFEATRKYPIKICVHTILGLPGETKGMMLDTARQMRRLRIDGIKIHPLHIIKGTALEKMYLEGLYTPLFLDDYADILSEFIGCLWRDTVIHRLSASCPKDMLAAPGWLEQANSIGRAVMGGF